MKTNCFALLFFLFILIRADLHLKKATRGTQGTENKQQHRLNVTDIATCTQIIYVVSPFNNLQCCTSCISSIREQKRDVEFDFHSSPLINLNSLDFFVPFYYNWKLLVFTWKNINTVVSHWRLIYSHTCCFKYILNTSALKSHAQSEREKKKILFFIRQHF